MNLNNLFENQSFNVNESHEDSLNIGDQVLVDGPNQFQGKRGWITGFGRNKAFVIVEINGREYSMHSSDVVSLGNDEDDEDYGLFGDDDREELDEYRGPHDRVTFEVDSEKAYNHIMDKYGHVIDWAGDYMTVPARYWPAVQELAFAAGGDVQEVELNEGFLGDREYNRVMPFVKRIASEVSDYDRDEFGEELWSLLDQKYGPKFAQSVLDDIDFYWDTYTELTDQQGVAEGIFDIFKKLPAPGSTVKIAGRPVEITHAGRGGNYIGFAWTDKNGKEHYEETPVEEHDNLRSLAKTIAAEIKYADDDGVDDELDAQIKGRLDRHFGKNKGVAEAVMRGGDEDYPGDPDYEDRDNEDEGFFVAIGNEEDGMFLGMITRDGGRWREVAISGNPPYNWGGANYMSYLTPQDVMQWINKDYGRYNEVEFFDSEEEARDYVSMMSEGVAEGHEETMLERKLANEVAYQLDQQRPEIYDEYGEEYVDRIIRNIVSHYTTTGHEKIGARGIDHMVREVINYITGISTKQGVAEGLGKNIKRGLQGWYKGDIGPSGEKLGDPKELVRRNKSYDDETLQRFAKSIAGEKKTKHSPGELQQRVIDREMRKRGLGEQGVAEDDAGDVEQRMIAKIAKEKQRLAKLKQTDPEAYKREMAKRKTSSKIPPVSTFEEQGVAEGKETINIGDDVVIVGNSAYEGIPGRVIGFKEGKIVVDMLEHGKVRFAPEKVKLYPLNKQGVAGRIGLRGLGENKVRPSNPQLWKQARMVAESKFHGKHNSASNTWAAKWYKSHGGTWIKE